MLQKITHDGVSETSDRYFVLGETVEKGNVSSLGAVRKLVYQQ